MGIRARVIPAGIIPRYAVRRRRVARPTTITLATPILSRVLRRARVGWNARVITHSISPARIATVRNITDVPTHTAVRMPGRIRLEVGGCTAQPP